MLKFGPIKSNGEINISTLVLDIWSEESWAVKVIVCG